MLYKFNKHGELKRQTYIGSPNFVAGNKITLLSDSSVVLIGSYAGAGATPTVINPPGAYSNTVGTSFILKFDTDLSTIFWSTRFPGNIADVDANSGDSIYVLGSTNTSSVGPDAAVIYTVSGALNLGYGNVNGPTAAYLCKFTENGVVTWGSFLPLGNIPGTTTLKIDKKRRHIYIAGTIYNPDNFQVFNNYFTFQDAMNSAVDVKEALKSDRVKLLFSIA